MFESYYDTLLLVMTVTALIVFVCLYFVKAGYGIFHTPKWGFSLNNKVGWVLMESPVFILMCFLWVHSGVGFQVPLFVCFLLFELHYFQRSFVFPFLMRGKSRIPIAVVLMGVMFNVINALMQAGALFYFTPDRMLHAGWSYFLQPCAIAGVIIFFLGMGINLHADNVIRHLRKPGDTKHYLSAKGMYKYVTSANYFGELLEWTGFAILVATPAAWVFVWWTFANLVPRANSIYHHYVDEFGKEAVGKRRRVIPFIY